MDGKGGESENVRTKIGKISRFVSHSVHVLLHKGRVAFHEVPLITFIVLSVFGLLLGSVTGMELAEHSERVTILKVVHAENTENIE